MREDIIRCEDIKEVFYFRPIMGSQDALNYFRDTITYHECVKPSKDFFLFYRYTPVTPSDIRKIALSIGGMFKGLIFIGFCYHGGYIAQFVFRHNDVQFLSNDHVWENQVPVMNPAGFVAGVATLGEKAKNGIRSAKFETHDTAWVADVIRTNELRQDKCDYNDDDDQLPF